MIGFCNVHVVCVCSCEMNACDSYVLLTCVMSTCLQWEIPEFSQKQS